MPDPVFAHDGLRTDSLRWATAGLLLLGLGLYCLWQAMGLQREHDHAYVGEAAAAALRDDLRGAGDSLQPTLRELLERETLRLRQLTLYDADGQLLARLGVFQQLKIPMLPPTMAERLRMYLYAFTGTAGSRRILDEDGRLLGQLEYRMAPGGTGAPPPAALAPLRWSAWAVLLGSFALCSYALLLGLRARDARPALARRMDPRGNDGGLGDAVGEQLLFEEFRARAGQVMDVLSHAIVSLDRDGRVRYLNGTAERLTGWPLSDARGQLGYSICHVMAADGLPMPNAAERALREGVDVPATPATLRMRHGELRPVEMTACLLRARDGGIEGVTLVLRDNTRQTDALDALRREARLSQAVIDYLDEGLLMTDPAGVVRFANARAERMFGYSRHELEGFTVTKLMPVPFLNAPDIRIVDYIAARGSRRLPRVVGWRKDATTFPIELWVQEMTHEDMRGLVVIVRDISERLRGENLATRLGRVLDNAMEEIYIFDAQSLYFLEVSRGARRNLGHPPESLARMSPLSISDELDPDVFQNYLTALRSGERDHMIYRSVHRRSDGSVYPVEVRLNFSRDEDPPVFMAIAVDISERLEAERRLQHLAHHDPLTGLPNRTMLFDRLEQARLAAQRSTRLLGVLFLDLDRFKQINDQHGHEVGDQVLKGVAERLKAVMRPTDTVARLAGDEFVLIAPGLRSVEDAGFLATKVLDRFAEVLDVPGLEILVRPSIGVTVYPVDDADVDGLLRHADAAMYEAKQAGRGCYRIFGTEIDPAMRRRLELEREIHAAVALNQFRLQVLPVLDAASGAVRMLLSELQWLHPRQGLVAPEELQRAAARAGLLADLELWQIYRACEHHQQAGQSAQVELPVLPLVIGISGWQLRDSEFIAHVLELLHRHDVPGDRLVLALTPDGMLDAVTVPDQAQRLLAAGVRFALRDFAAMPALDGGLVRVLLAGECLVVDGRSCETLLQDAQARGLQVIAQDISTEAQRRQWSAMGCALLAGPAVQAGMDLSEVSGWLRGRRVEPL